MTTFSVQDREYMCRALQLARRGLYTTAPNPRVGCVIVHGDEVVGEGWHAFAGGPHAEVGALAEAGERAYGATAYVTLEPCSHHGRTPPCAEALIEAGVARVVAAMVDPNPRVSGNGLKRLKEAGVEVASGLLEAEAEALNIGFVRRMRAKRPYVRCKLAMSVDGRTAMANGESKWITGPAAREDVQRLRARSGAIITGIGTVLADDPNLTVRLEGLGENGVEPPPPLRVVLDPRLSTPLDASILQGPGKVLIATASHDSEDAEALTAKGAEVVHLPQGPDRVDLDALLLLLATREVNEVLIETGATLSGSALADGLVDELILYMAPKLMGDGARGLFHLPEITGMQQAIDLTIDEIRPVGRDFRITARVAPKEG